ncbi:terpene utilization protein AtuA [Afipia sp. P52-10]|uniref:acyclic terpene utilization AtuA family protein n=1 Tax=Afipia sp. P52-10 TaxID=1429916 RepID=UPI0003DF17E9|nr:acyclic terpene utilization AtuA family protein [Afipia sp. P52-10]ETR76901.1 terpene utilization protein AtuA [Afipia sp. P52-10]
MSKTLRIGGGGGFWGDTEHGAIQLVEKGSIDVLIMDYLAEITMSLLARARARQPQAGFAPDFVSMMERLAKPLADKAIRVVVNAGGVNPLGCRDAIEAALKKAGVTLRVAVVTGDDVMPLADELRAEDSKEMFSGSPLPKDLWSMNAYLGARPIAAALAAGADIVITGRCTDSALALGPLMHAFGWGDDDYDHLAMGSLVGHILECGTQATGGITTDWQDVPGWEDMGFPIAECSADGTFVLSKPDHTGGLINRQTVAEQVVYEIGDPKRYILPDVVCDFSNVRIDEIGPNLVRISGAQGTAPTPSYKVSATYADGFKASGTMMIAGRDAAAKARRTAEAILARSRRLMTARSIGDFRRTSIEVLGAEETYGANARAGASREVILKVAVHHDDKEACEIFSREFLPSATAMAQGITGFAAGRPKVAPLVRLHSLLIDKSRLTPRVTIGDRTYDVKVSTASAAVPSADAPPPPPAAPPAGPLATVPLIALAYGRSGDKGDSANIGVLARRPEFVDAIDTSLTADAVKTYFAHIVTGPVERFPLPGLHGFNFVLHGALDGGGVASLRHDPQGKAFAQMLLDAPIQVPRAWLNAQGPLANFAASEGAAS